MADSNSPNRFLAFLSRIRSYRPLDRRDSRSISHLAVSEHTRHEQPIHYTNQNAAYEQFLTTGLKTFSTEDDGLESLGWKKLTGGPTFQQGACASICMAYKLSDRGTPLESRHLAVAKIQGVEMETWTEVQILRGLVHENIVDLYGVFAVDPQWRSEDADNYPTLFPDRRVLWMLLEYANAGDLFKETKRYENKSIPESGARYYMLQVCAGLEHMHSRRVIHRDLHSGNILMKYKSDGTKVCMICDFGLSWILGPDDDLDTQTRFDVKSLSKLLWSLVHHIPNISFECMQVISMRHFESEDRSEPYTVRELLTYSWFKRPAVPPIPKAPTPLLHPDAVQEIGYLQPMDPAGTTSPPTKPQFGPKTFHESDSLAQRMGRNLRAASHRVATRVRSLTGRDRQPSAETHGTAHGREQVSPVARTPSRESSPVREQPLEEEQQGAAEPDRPSRSSRVRNRLTSMGRAIARPFRRSFDRLE